MCLASIMYDAACSMVHLDKRLPERAAFDVEKTASDRGGNSAWGSNHAACLHSTNADDVAEIWIPLSTDLAKSSVAPDKHRLPWLGALAFHH